MKPSGAELDNEVLRISRESGKEPRSSSP